MNKLQRGFTLLELMVTLAIVGIVAAIAFWDSSDMLENNRAENFLLELKRNVSFARAKAAASDETVVLCAVPFNQVRKNNEKINCKAKWDANKVIIVFVDADKNENYNSDTDTILRVMEKIPDTSKLSFTGNRRLIYDTSGRNLSSDGVFTFCPNKNNDNNKALTITVSGTALYNGDTDTTCD